MIPGKSITQGKQMMQISAAQHLSIFSNKRTTKKWSSTHEVGSSSPDLSRLRASLVELKKVLVALNVPQYHLAIAAASSHDVGVGRVKLETEDVVWGGEKELWVYGVDEAPQDDQGGG